MTIIGDLDSKLAELIMAPEIGVPNPACKMGISRPVLECTTCKMNKKQALAAFDEFLQIRTRLLSRSRLFPIHEMQHHKIVTVQCGRIQKMRIFHNMNLKSRISSQCFSQSRCSQAPFMSRVVLHNSVS